MDISETPITSQKWRTILTVFTLVALGLMVFFLWDQIVETVSNVTRIPILLLILILLWRLLSFHAYAALYRDLFAILSHKLSYKSMYRVGLELNFVNLVFPSAGVSGFSYFGLRMKKLGVSTGKATLVQMMRFVLSFVSFQILLVAGVFMLAVHGGASQLTILVASSLVTLTIISTLLMAYVIGSRTRIDSFFTIATKFINRIIQFVRPKHPETISVDSVRRVFLELHENYLILKDNYTKLKKPFWNAFLANVAEIATLYTVYIAFSSYVNPGAIILAYAVANFAGLISVLPGGIGIYEGLMTAVLVTAGVPAAVSIPVTITYRVLTIGMQVPIGYYFYHKTLNPKRPKPV